jgi:hypothetical protein
VPDFFEHALPPDTPAGEYTVFLVLAVIGAVDDGRLDPGDILTAAMAGFTVPP